MRRELTIEGIERIARSAIRDRLRNASAEHAIIAVRAGAAPGSVLLHFNSGGNALAAEAALRSAGYHVEDGPPMSYGVGTLVTGPSDGEER